MKIMSTSFKKLFGLLVLFTLSASTLKAQLTLRGKIAAEESNRLIEGATITLNPMHKMTKSASDGSFVLTGLKTGVYQLEISSVGLVKFAKTIKLNKDTVLTVMMTDNSSNLNEVSISVGNRGKSRSIIKSPVPVQLISSQEIKTSGYTNTAELIQMLVPSFTQNRIVRGDGSETIRPSTMRGMGTDQMLVLVNGKRRHISAFLIADNTGVDLNAIPVSAIESIEVLKDGAAAIYGSDAIAGVINIILKKDTGGSVDVQSGITSRGDGFNTKIGIDKGFALKNNGVLNVAVQGLYVEKTVRAGADLRKQYFGTIKNAAGNVTYSDPVGDAKNAAYAADPKVTMIEGDPQKKVLGTMINYSQPLKNEGKIYAFGGVNYNNTLNGSNRFRLPGDDGTVRSIYPDGFLARGKIVTTDYSFAGGYKQDFKLLGMMDASVSLGGNSVQFNLLNSDNPSLGAKSPTDFYLGTHHFNQYAANLDFVKALDQNKVYSLAYGAEFRVENYSIKAGEEASYIDGGVPILDGPNAGKRAPVGSQGYVGYRPSNAVAQSRNTSAAYAELTADFTKSFTVSAATRYEYYSDFGSTINGKISARYEFIKGYAIRGAANTGFRAPSLQQSYFSQTQTNYTLDPAVGQIVSRENSTLPINSPAAIALGAQPLKPEKSYNVSAGLTALPVKNLFITADLYAVRVNDRIVRTSFFTTSNPLIKKLFDDYNIVGIQSARYFANAIDTRTQGIDIVAQYELHANNLGHFTFLASYNYNLLKIVGVHNSATLASLNENIFNPERIAATATKQNNFTMSIVHNLNGFTSSLRVYRAGELSNQYPIAQKVIGLNTMPALVTLDAEVSYQFKNKVRFGIGANNIFDKMPPLNDPSLSFNGNFKYYNGNNSQLGVTGAYYYAKLGYSF